MSELYKRHNYTDKYNELLIGNEIYEYDIKSAGFNLIKRKKLIPQNKIDKLETLPKKLRQIQIGLLIRSDKKLKDDLNNAFIDIRREFFEANNLSDDHILSIKKDAIFTFKPCQETIFDNVEFVRKNVYSSFLLIDKKEIYVNKDTLHVKGISDDKVELHRKGICDVLHSCLMMLENLNESQMKEFLMDVSEMYKRRELPVEFYREFNRESCYRYIDDGSVLFETIGDVEMLDIRYNYLNILITLQNILI